MTARSVAERPAVEPQTARRGVIFLVPDGIDDPLRVSGGNVYDQHVRDRLEAHGWAPTTVEVRDAGGAAGPARPEASGGDVGTVVRRLPDGATVLVDGLVAGWAPEDFAAAARRARLVVLAHMVVAAFPDATPAQIDAERRVLAAAHRVVVTSRWTARELERRGLVDAARLSIAAPGAAASLVDREEEARHAASAPRSGATGPPSRAASTRRGPSLPPPGAETAHAAPSVRTDAHLLCVGVVAPHKGQDVLLAALARLTDREWTCTIAGSTGAAPEFAAALGREAASLDGRVRFTGVLGRAALAAEYERCGLLVAPSRVESAGMAIGEAQARGIPVVAADVGGIRDTVSHGGAMLVPADDPAALAAALQAWLTDPAVRRRLRHEALAARTNLPTWDDTAAGVAAALEAT